MEIIDIYNGNREKTGRTIIRDNIEKLKEGEYHLIAQAIIINSNNQLFLGKRSEKKKNNPLKWETIGGAVVKDETTLDGMIRELNEELGVEFLKDEARLYKTMRIDRVKVFKDIWLFKKDIKIENLTFPDNEVISAKWVTISEFETMLINQEIVKNIDLTVEDIKEAISMVQ